jgi:hypothetical protein
MRYQSMTCTILCFVLAGCLTGPGQAPERSAQKSSSDAEPVTAREQDAKVPGAASSALKADLSRRLLEAVLRKDISAIESLLDSGADPNAPQTGFTYSLVDGKRVDRPEYALFAALTASSTLNQEGHSGPLG